MTCFHIVSVHNSLYNVESVYYNYLWIHYTSLYSFYTLTMSCSNYQSDSDTSIEPDHSSDWINKCDHKSIIYQD